MVLHEKHLVSHQIYNYGEVRSLGMVIAAVQRLLAGPAKLGGCDPGGRGVGRSAENSVGAV